MNAVLVLPQPKIYHIAHLDRLPSIVADGFLWCDAEVVRLTYRRGQGPILHFESDPHAIVAWADAPNLRWAFTLSNEVPELTVARICRGPLKKLT